MALDSSTVRVVCFRTVLMKGSSLTMNVLDGHNTLLAVGSVGKYDRVPMRG